MRQQTPKAVRKRVRKLPVSRPPAPWRKATCAAVGGLWEVGFAPESDLLLVVSAQGRAVFDCSTGERVARDRAEPADSWYSEFSLSAIGIDPLHDVRINLAGLHGGGLTQFTRDGWWVDTLTLEWPEHHLLLGGPGSWLFDQSSTFYKLAVELEVRAFGFSETGRSLVLATSSDVGIWHR